MKVDLFSFEASLVKHATQFAMYLHEALFPFECLETKEQIIPLCVLRAAGKNIDNLLINNMKAIYGAFLPTMIVLYLTVLLYYYRIKFTSSIDWTCKQFNRQSTLTWCLVSHSLCLYTIYFA